MEADDRGGYLHSVVGSKSTPARGTRRMKQEKRIALQLLLAVTYPYFVDLSSPLISLFPPYFSTSWPLPFYIPASFLPLPITFQCFCRFHLTALPHLCLHQPNFLSFSLTVAFSLFPSPPSSLLTSYWQNLSRQGKGGQLCHNIDSHFIATAMGLPGSWIDGLGLFHWAREQL